MAERSRRRSSIFRFFNRNAEEDRKEKERKEGEKKEKTGRERRPSLLQRLFASRPNEPSPVLESQDVAQNHTFHDGLQRMNVTGRDAASTRSYGHGPRLWTS